MSEHKNVSNGTPWLWIFTFILAVLKLTELANISWWIVFAPLWLPVLVAVLIFIVGFISLFVYEYWKSKK